MLIESRFIVSSLFISTVLLFLAWIAALVGKSEAFEKHVEWWRKQRLLKRAAVVAVLIGVIAYAGTKPDPSGGDDTGGSSTNDVTQVEGDAGSTNDVGWGEGDLDGTNDVVGCDVLGAPQPMSNGNPLLGGCGALGTARPTLTPSFSLVSVGHDETFDFTPPETAVVATNWLLHGASTQPLRLSFDDWVFPFGEKGYSNFTVFAYGVVMPGEVNTNHFLVPFGASLGIAPVTNWHLLSTNGNQTIEQSEQSNNSLFWSGFSPSNTLLLTWQNALLEREATNPVSFQAELKPSGGFTFRYDLSRLVSDELLTNVTVGVCDGRAGSPCPPQSIQNEGSFVCDCGAAGVRALPGRTLSSLSFVSHDEQLCNENREDFDARIGDEDPYAYPEGSTNTVLEHVFYSGTTNGPFAYPQSTDGNAVLMVSVSGSGSGELMVGSKFVPLVGRPAPVSAPRLFAAPPPSPSTLAVSVPRGSTQRVYMRGDSTLSVSFDSDDFAFGELPDLSGRHFGGWINFPFVNATVPCIHDYNARKKLVSLPRGGGADELTCEWQGTSQIEVENIPPVSAMLTGHFSGRTTTPVTYTLSHPNYLFGQSTFSQTARYCPQPPEEDDEDPDHPQGGEPDWYDGDGEDDHEEHYCWCCFWGSCYEGCGCGCSCYVTSGSGDEPEPLPPDPEPEDYEETNTNYPHMSDVLKIRDPLEYTIPIHLTVPTEHRNCCPCPDHATNWVGVVYQSSRVKVVDAVTEQDFHSSGESLDVKVAGVAPSSAVGDAAVSFAANGEVCLECAYTVLGVGIDGGYVPNFGNADLKMLNQRKADFGLPILVNTNLSVAAELELVTNVRLPFGNIHLGFEDSTAPFEAWIYDCRTSEYLKLASSTDGALDISFAGWRQLVGGSSDSYSPTTWIYITAAGAGKATLVYRYWGVSGSAMVEDEARQVISSIDPPLMADVNRDGEIDGLDGMRQIAQNPFRFWYNSDVVKGDCLGQVSDSSPNADDLKVNGKFDLVNLFPLQVDVTRFQEAWGRAATFRLRARTQDLRFCVLGEDISAHVAQMQTRTVQTVGGECLERASLTPLDYAGTNLVDILPSVASPAVLAFEAKDQVHEWESPELVVSLDDREVFTYRIPLSITSVDEMYQFGDLRAAATDPSHVPSVRPLAWEQATERKDLDVFFTHGFNVNLADAREWGRHMFKRLWHAGSNARFHMLTWEGDYSWLPGDLFNGLHYQHDVWYALRTGGAFKRYVEAAQPDANKRILMAQSLGNMVVCEALKEGLHADKYFMFDAAIPSEALDGTLQDADATVRAKYVPADWEGYDPLSWAANWHRWFSHDATDARGKMGWPDYFTAAIGNAANIYNYYSSGDDVFKEFNTVPSRFDGLDVAIELYCWQKQETLKGSAVLTGTAYGGWAFHQWTIHELVQDIGGGSHYEDRTYRYSSEDAARMIADGSITNNPVFNSDFSPMFDSDASLDDQRLALGKYVPAVSSPVGGTAVFEQDDNVVDMNDSDVGIPRLNGWGRDVNHRYGLDWQHSDMKNMSFFYVYQLFEDLMEKGHLK